MMEMSSSNELHVNDKADANQTSISPDIPLGLRTSSLLNSPSIMDAIDPFSFSFSFLSSKLFLHFTDVDELTKQFNKAATFPMSTTSPRASPNLNDNTRGNTRPSQDQQVEMIDTQSSELLQKYQKILIDVILTRLKNVHDVICFILSIVSSRSNNTMSSPSLSGISQNSSGNNKKIYRKLLAFWKSVVFERQDEPLSALVHDFAVARLIYYIYHPKVIADIRRRLVHLLGIIMGAGTTTLSLRRCLTLASTSFSLDFELHASILGALSQSASIARERMGPQTLFLFEGGRESKIEISAIGKWPFAKEYRLCCWLFVDQRCESFNLLSLTTGGRHGINIMIAGNSLTGFTIMFESSDEKKSDGCQIQIPKEMMRHRAWHYLSIYHYLGRFFASSEVVVTIDDKPVSKEPHKLYFPQKISLPITTARLFEEFEGATGAITIFRDSSNTQLIQRNPLEGIGLSHCIGEPLKTATTANPANGTGGIGLPAGDINTVFAHYSPNQVVFIATGKNPDESQNASESFSSDSSKNEQSGGLNDDYMNVNYTRKFFALDLHNSHLGSLGSCTQVWSLHSVQDTLRSVGGSVELLPFLWQQNTTASPPSRTPSLSSYPQDLLAELKDIKDSSDNDSKSRSNFAKRVCLALKLIASFIDAHSCNQDHLQKVHGPALISSALSQVFSDSQPITVDIIDTLKSFFVACRRQRVGTIDGMKLRMLDYNTLEKDFDEHLLFNIHLWIQCGGMVEIQGYDEQGRSTISCFLLHLLDFATKRILERPSHFRKYIGVSSLIDGLRDVYLHYQQNITFIKLKASQKSTIQTDLMLARKVGRKIVEICLMLITEGTDPRFIPASEAAQKRTQPAPSIYPEEFHRILNCATGLVVAEGDMLEKGEPQIQAPEATSKKSDGGNIYAFTSLPWNEFRKELAHDGLVALAFMLSGPSPLSGAFSLCDSLAQGMGLASVLSVSIISNGDVGDRVRSLALKIIGLYLCRSSYQMHKRTNSSGWKRPYVAGSTLGGSFYQNPMSARMKEFSQEGGFSYLWNALRFVLETGTSRYMVSPRSYHLFPPSNADRNPNEKRYLPFSFDLMKIVLRSGDESQSSPYMKKWASNNMEDPIDTSTLNATPSGFRTGKVQSLQIPNSNSSMLQKSLIHKIPHISSNALSMEGLNLDQTYNSLLSMIILPFESEVASSDSQMVVGLTPIATNTSTTNSTSKYFSSMNILNDDNDVSSSENSTGESNINSNSNILVLDDTVQIQNVTALLLFLRLLPHMGLFYQLKGLQDLFLLMRYKKENRQLICNSAPSEWQAVLLTLLGELSFSDLHSSSSDELQLLNSPSSLQNKKSPGRSPKRYSSAAPSKGSKLNESSDSQREYFMSSPLGAESPFKDGDQDRFDEKISNSFEEELSKENNVDKNENDFESEEQKDVQGKKMCFDLGVKIFVLLLKESMPGLDTIVKIQDTSFDVGTSSGNPTLPGTLTISPPNKSDGWPELEITLSLVPLIVSGENAVRNILWRLFTEINEIGASERIVMLIKEKLVAAFAYTNHILFRYVPNMELVHARAFDEKTSERRRRFSSLFSNADEATEVDSPGLMVSNSDDAKDVSSTLPKSTTTNINTEHQENEPINLPIIHEDEIDMTVAEMFSTTQIAEAALETVDHLLFHGRASSSLSNKERIFSTPGQLSPGYSQHLKKVESVLFCEFQGATLFDIVMRFSIECFQGTDISKNAPQAIKHAKRLMDLVKLFPELKFQFGYSNTSVDEKDHCFVVNIAPTKGGKGVNVSSGAISQSIEVGQSIPDYENDDSDELIDSFRSYWESNRSVLYLIDSYIIAIMVNVRAKLFDIHSILYVEDVIHNSHPQLANLLDLSETLADLLLLIFRNFSQTLKIAFGEDFEVLDDLVRETIQTLRLESQQMQVHQFKNSSPPTQSQQQHNLTSHDSGSTLVDDENGSHVSGGHGKRTRSSQLSLQKNHNANPKFRRESSWLFHRWIKLPVLNTRIRRAFYILHFTYATISDSMQKTLKTRWEDYLQREKSEWANGEMRAEFERKVGEFEGKNLLIEKVRASSKQSRDDDARATLFEIWNAILTESFIRDGGIWSSSIYYLLQQKHEQFSLFLGDVFAPAASSQYHWMISEREDHFRRHILFKPNLDFDDHRFAVSNNSSLAREVKERPQTADSGKVESSLLFSSSNANSPSNLINSMEEIQATGINDNDTVSSSSPAEIKKEIDPLNLRPTSPFGDTMSISPAGTSSISLTRPGISKASSTRQWKVMDPSSSSITTEESNYVTKPFAINEDEQQESNESTEAEGAAFSLSKDENSNNNSNNISPKLPQGIISELEGPGDTAINDASISSTSEQSEEEDDDVDEGENIKNQIQASGYQSFNEPLLNNVKIAVMNDTSFGETTSERGNDETKSLKSVKSFQSLKNNSILRATAFAATRESVIGHAKSRRQFSLRQGETLVHASDDCRWITPLQVIEGQLEVSTLHIFFYANEKKDESNNNNNNSWIKSGLDDTAKNLDMRSQMAGKNMMRWRLDSLVEVHNRRYLLRATALELFFSDSTNIFFAFSNSQARKSFLDVMMKQYTPKLERAFASGAISPRIVFERSKVTDLWVNRKISNFEYLMKLNTIAGRTYNDITQYPVFPWVIADYESDSLDLNDPKVYRDLSKPVGALNPERLTEFIDRYESLLVSFDPDTETGGIPAFHYGTHYSSAGVVLHYLVRIEPYTTLAIDLQGGKFDLADRMFFSIKDCWKSCMNSNADVKELIPEFFYLPEMFKNEDGFNFGYRLDGRYKVSDVELPKWAKSAEDFVRINRMALESEYVSRNLHHWIDLIFGYKQMGPEAVKAHNVFFYLTYEGTINIDEIKDPVQREGIESQIAHYGQTPSQLLKTPHPQRKPLVIDSIVKELVYDDGRASGSYLLTDLDPNFHFSPPGRELAMSPSSISSGVSSPVAGSGGRVRGYKESVWSLDTASQLALSSATGRSSTGGRASSLLQFGLLSSGISSELSSTASASFTEPPCVYIGSYPDRLVVVHEDMSFTSCSWDVVRDSTGKSYSLKKGQTKLLPMAQYSYAVRARPRDVAIFQSGLANKMRLTSNHFLSVSRGRLLISCNYFDGRIHIHNIDINREEVSLVAHRGRVTCLALDETSSIFASGSVDCTIGIWRLVGTHNDVRDEMLDLFGIPNSVSGSQILKSSNKGSTNTVTRSKNVLFPSFSSNLDEEPALPGMFTAASNHFSELMAKEEEEDTVADDAQGGSKSTLSKKRSSNMSDDKSTPQSSAASASPKMPSHHLAGSLSQHGTIQGSPAKFLRHLVGHQAPISCIFVCTKNGLVASADIFGVVLLHTLHDGVLLRKLERSIMLNQTKVGAGVDIICIAPVSNYIITHSRSEKIIDIFTAHGTHLYSKDVDEELEWIQVASDLDEEVILTGGSKEEIYVRSLPKLKKIKYMNHPKNRGVLRCGQLSQDGKHLFIGAEDGNVIVLDYRR